MKSTTYRSRIRICFDILKVIKDEEGLARPTRILYGANLSHDRLMRYLNELLETGLIKKVEREGRVCYSLTQKGGEFLREFRKMEEFLNAFGFAI